MFAVKLVEIKAVMNVLRHMYKDFFVCYLCTRRTVKLTLTILLAKLNILPFLFVDTYKRLG